MFPPMVHRSAGAAPLENPAPHFRRIFRPAFLEALPVVPAAGRLSGLPFLHGFFHGNFSRKNAGKLPPISGGCLPVLSLPADSGRLSLRLLLSAGPGPGRAPVGRSKPPENSRRGILCARYSFLEDYIFTPPIVPQNRLFPVKSPKNSPQILCKKSSPRPPLGGLGERFSGGLTAARPSANIRDKPRPHGPGPANRRHPGGVQKGEVNVNTPNVAELLVQQTEKATRLAVEVEQLRQRLQEIARLSAECNDPDELRRELDRLTRQQ